MPSDATILTAAAQIVDADREKTYGDPGRNLRAIAAFWTDWLASRGWISPDGHELTTDDVACMMVMLKLARLANDTTHRDSQIDACGYLRLMERCQDASNSRDVPTIAPEFSTITVAT